MKDFKEIKSAILLTVLVGLSFSAAYSEIDTFTIDYTFQPVIKDDQWTIKDTLTREIPEEPLIPYKTARILLPQGTAVENVAVECSEPVLQEGFDISWGSPAYSVDSSPALVGKNEDIYNSSRWYPETVYDVVSTHSFRGFNILYVNLYPLQYQPQSGAVKFYPTLTITVGLEKGTNSLYRGFREDKEAVKTMVDNPEVLQTYSEQVNISEEVHEYIIITNSTLTPVFQTLAAHKDSYITGTTEIVDVEWIYANFTGCDNPEKIRTFIKYAYNNWGTIYCLLGGDISVVPYRGFYVTSGGYTDYDMAADMYFGCLDGTFNDDGDNRWAEPTDGVDWLEEVFIGRAPVETVSEAETFVNKVISYELAPREKVCQYHAAGVGTPDLRQIAWDCEYWTPADYVKKELFEADQPVTKDLWIKAWEGSYDGEPYYPPVMFQHAGAGNTGLYSINSNVMWYISDISSLTNDNFWPVHTSVGSYCGEFTANDCLGEAFVIDDCGAIACYFNDNMAWFSILDPSKYSGDFLETEFRALFSDGTEHLGELLNQAKSYWVSAAETNSTYRWCYYEINLLGDPESPCLTQRVVPPTDTVTITNPLNGSEVYGIVDVTVSVTGCIDMVEFLVDSVLKYTDTAPPFGFAWNTYRYTEDQQHTVLVKGYCSGEFKDDDTVTVTVNNFLIDITSPKEGETVSGIVTVTTDVRGYEVVEFYIDGVLKYTDTAPPFQFGWDTKEYKDGKHTITVKGYAFGVIVEKDDVWCIVNNNSEYLRTVFVFLIAYLW